MAGLARRDRHHRLCVDLIEHHRKAGVVVVPVTVAVEVDYLVRSRAGAEAARRFLADLEAGALQSEPIDDHVLARACAIDRAYADADLGFVDASVMAVAESLNADAILTLDHAHFRIVRETAWTLQPAEHELG